MSEFQYIWDGFTAKNKISILKPLNYLKPIPVTIFCTALAYYMTPKILANLGYPNLSEGILLGGTMLFGLMVIASVSIACFNTWFPQLGLNSNNKHNKNKRKVSP